MSLWADTVSRFLWKRTDALGVVAEDALAFLAGFRSEFLASETEVASEVTHNSKSQCSSSASVPSPPALVVLSSIATMNYVVGFRS